MPSTALEIRSRAVDGITNGRNLRCTGCHAQAIRDDALDALSA